MSAHTRGPWQALPEESDKDYLRIRGTRLGGRYKIANVSALKYEGVDPREAAETQANARLICAAPDLFEALIAMVDRWEPDTSGTDRVMHDSARAAIAKARGAAL